MKSTFLALLVVTLLVSIVSLLASLGIIGGGGGGKSSGGGAKEYLVLNGEQMDQIGFGAIAEEDGMEPDEKGQVRFNAEKLRSDPRAFRTNLLPVTIQKVESEGWSFVGVASDNHYIFAK